MKYRIILLFFMTALLSIQAQEVVSDLTVTLPGNIPMHFMHISPGKFIMGSDTIEQDRHADEDPVRKIRITEGFYLGKFEVTQEQWVAIMKKNPSIFKNQPEWKNLPVENVSWYDCIAFIDSLNNSGKGTFRLPTEAEWEYACRAGTNTRYYWGEDPDDTEVYKYAWAFSRAEGKSHPVGTKKPNAWGLYDMSGNVWEWCSDWREKYEKSDTINPQGASNGTKKIYRGGSWFNKPATLRSANRNGHPPDTKGSNSGLRVILEIKD